MEELALGEETEDVAKDRRESEGEPPREHRHGLGGPAALRTRQARRTGSALTCWHLLHLLLLEAGRQAAWSQASFSGAKGGQT